MLETDAKMQLSSTYLTIFALFVIFSFDCCHAYKRTDVYGRPQHQCVPVRAKLCSGCNYHLTTMPNILGHETQEEASKRLLEFALLLQWNYSAKLHFFLCSLFFPMCTDQVSVAIPACRPMCEEVKAEYEPLMKRFDFEWPDSINCSKLPLKEEEGTLCMQPDPGEDIECSDGDTWNFHGFSQGSFSLPLDMNDPSTDHFGSKEEAIPPDAPAHSLVYSDPNEDYPGGDQYQDAMEEGRISEDEDLTGSHIETDYGDPKYKVDSSFSPEYEGRSEENYPEVNSEDEEILSVNQYDPQPKPPYQFCKNSFKFMLLKRDDTCVARCGPSVNVLFSNKDRQVAYIVLSVCASLCFLSTAVTISTFAIDSQRFRYPERPVMFLSLSYHVYALGHLIQTIRGIQAPISCITDKDSGMRHLVAEEYENTLCTVTFFLLYYFGMAGSAWWVVLNLAWLLSAGFKWGHEAISKYGFYFHVAAWSAPAAQTVAVMVLNKIDGDELTGLCYVGNMDPDSLMYFVIIPLTFYLIVGSVTLAFGFSYLFKIRRVIKHQNGKEASNLEKLMLKIGLFSVLYSVPAACIVAVNFYQYQNSSFWMNEAKTYKCTLTNSEQAWLAPDLYRPGLNHDYAYHNYQGHSPSRRSGGQYMTNLDQKNLPYSSYETGFQDTKSQNLIPEKNTFELSNDFEAADLGLNCSLTRSIPSLPVFIIKIVMSLIAGIMSGMWVWSRKTIRSWRNFCSSCGCKMDHYEQKKKAQDGNSYSTCPGVTDPLLTVPCPPIMTSRRGGNTYNCSPGICRHSTRMETGDQHDSYIQVGSYNSRESQMTQCSEISPENHMPRTAGYGDMRCHRHSSCYCTQGSSRKAKILESQRPQNNWHSSNGYHLKQLAPQYGRGESRQCRHSNPISHFPTTSRRCSRNNRDEDELLFLPRDKQLMHFEETPNPIPHLGHSKPHHSITNDINLPCKTECCADTTVNTFHSG